MENTSLLDELAKQGAERGEYAGAPAAVSFGDPRRELTALRTGCGIYELGWQGKLVVSGGDRSRWLNGMVTNNVRDLAVNRGNYSFLLNPQGRILGDLNAYNRGEIFLLTSDLPQLPKLREFLDRYIIMDDVELTDISEKLGSIGIAGPAAVGVLQRFGAPVDLEPGEVRDCTFEGTGYSLVRGTLGAPASYEIWASPGQLPRLWKALVSAGAVPAGAQALEWLRILHGIPRYGQDITERYLPQETGQTHALHFAKGCYIGQEIVERIRARALLHRGFTGLQLQGALPAIGAEISAGGKKLGEITTTATIPFAEDERSVALGYIRKESSEPGTQVQAGDTSATVSALPFKF